VAATVSVLSRDRQYTMPEPSGWFLGKEAHPCWVLIRTGALSLSVQVCKQLHTSTTQRKLAPQHAETAVWQNRTIRTVSGQKARSAMRDKNEPPHCM